jgi:type VI secretion system protein ImpK
MSSDNSDKTVFRQQMADGDRTIIRPMPGGRGASPGQPLAGHNQQQFNPTSNVRAAAPRVEPSASAYINNNSYFSTSKGLNPLVNAASALLAVFAKIRQSMSHPNVGGLYQSLIDEIKTFETKAKESGIKPEIVLASRYALCAALDEAVLNTPWGSESAWPQRTLLSVFHNETSGGEKFFMLLERMKEQPAENLYVLELMYILLSLGFEGKFRVIHRGRESIEKIRDDLFSSIRRQRGEYERGLSPSWQGLGRVNNSLVQYLPMWVIASVVCAILFVSYSGFRVWLYNMSSPVVDKLGKVAEMRVTEREVRERDPGN